MLDKTYRPAEIEAKFDRLWQERGHFAPSDDPGARPYCIVIPPPNVTGSLHMGHALNNSIQDALIRFHRMSGRAALWQPGSDHAGIATQMVVERQLMERQQPGRPRSCSRNLPATGLAVGEQDGHPLPAPSPCRPIRFPL